MMKSTRLSSGNISDFSPIGQDGNPVYLNADAFRAALAINPTVGEERVRHLAIPEISSDGSSIEWYAPFPPSNPDGQYRIVHWASATPDERSAALAQLRDLELRLQKLGNELSRRSGDNQSKLFAAYLTGQSSSSKLPAIHFPSPEYVYIVDGIPVITFWGFADKACDLNESPLNMLKNVAPAAAVGAAALGAGAAAAAPYSGPVASEPLPETNPQQDQGGGHNCNLFGGGGHNCGLGLPGCGLKLLLGLILLPLLLALLYWLISTLCPNLGLPTFGGGAKDAGSAQEQVVDQPPAEEPLPDGQADPVTETPQEQIPADGTAVVDSGTTTTTVTDTPVTQGAGTATMLTEETAAPVNGAATATEIPAEEAMTPTDAAAPVAPVDTAATEEPLSEQTAATTDTAAEEVPVALDETQVQEPVAPVDPHMPVQENDPLANLPPETRAAIEEARAAEAAAMNQTVPPEIAANTQNTATAVKPVAPVDIQFTQQDVATKGVSVVNGNWGTRSALMDQTNGKPLQMAYNLKDGKGKVIVTRPDGVKCTADVGTAAANGAIDIAANGRAVCPDNKTYRIPEIKCEPEANGKVNCVGTINNQKFPIELYSGK